MGEETATVAVSSPTGARGSGDVLLLDPGDEAVVVVGEVERGGRELGAAVVDEAEQGLEAAGVGAGAAGELLAAEELGWSPITTSRRRGLSFWM
jgi:hypothetical protein